MVLVPTSLSRRIPVGFWPGLFLGLIAHFISAFALILAYWLLRPFVWAALYGEPYFPPPGSGSYPTQSGQWLFVQAIWFASACILGVTIARWSGTSGRKVLAVLLLAWIALSAISEPNHVASIWRISMSYLKSPLGMLFGYFWWRFKSVP